MLDYFSFLFPFCFYLVFLAVIWLGGVFSGPTPNGSFTKAHFFSIPIFAAAYGAWVFYGDYSLGLLDFLASLLVYVMLHYAYIVNFFSLASRSVSSTLLVELGQHESLSSRDLMAGYAHGKGFAFIKENRLENMLKYELAEKSSDDYYIATARGRAFVKLLRFTLSIWGLQQIGRTPK